MCAVGIGRYSATVSNVLNPCVVADKYGAACDVAILPTGFELRMDCYGIFVNKVTYEMVGRTSSYWTGLNWFGILGRIEEVNQPQNPCRVSQNF
jgi:hypothetical protein